MQFKNIIDKNAENIPKQCSILLLIKTFISYQSGYLVNNLNLLVDKLCKLSEANNDPQLVKELVETSKLLLICENIKFPIDKIRMLISKLDTHATQEIVD